MAIDTDELAPPAPAGEEPPWTVRYRGWIVRSVVIAAFLVFLQLTAPEVLSASTSSFDAFSRVFGLIIGFLVWSAIVRRFVPNRWASLALVAVPAVAVSWWALEPYYVDDVVNEDFPVAAGAATDSPADDVDEAAPAEDATSDPATVPAPAAETPTEPSEPSEPPAPVALRSGTFQGLTGHDGEGTATLYDLGDGTQVVRFTEFDIDNGPGLEVHFVPGADARSPGDGTKVADLTGNVGDQNYEVPAGIDLSSGDWTILIYCSPFSVETANATLT